MGSLTLSPGAMFRQLRQTWCSYKSARSQHSKYNCCRHPSPCFSEIDHKPCFDINRVVIDRGNQCHSKMIRSFLYTHYWPREPAIVGLWMSICSPYLEVLTEKYANSGDRFLAFERDERTNERKLIGVLIANQTPPWVPDELEEWAQNTCLRPERHHMYFNAHCIRKPDLFGQHHAPYIYDIQVLATASEVMRQGVGTMLVRTALDHAYEVHHPTVQLVATSAYGAKCCSRNAMMREWSMDYKDFIDDAGRSVFCPRTPHTTVSVFSKKYDHNDPAQNPCKPSLLQ